MSDAPGEAQLASLVPLFPLPGLVLFPRAVVPLHVFEDRYKAMMDVAVTGDEQLAMALLKDGWEKDYYQAPAIEPVVCVGTILSWERLPDGRYNLLLQGRTRGRVVREVSRRPYRVAEVTPLAETPVVETELEEEREELREIFAGGEWADTVAGPQFQRVLSSSLRTAEIADLVAYTFLDDAAQKQSLLADEDVHRRVRHVVIALRKMRPVLSGWRRRTLSRPGVN
jgi:Lon protease-like protein